jgi:uncharacterized protein YaiE (UPF0345 family)
MALSVIDSTGLSNPFGAPATGNVMASWTTSARPASPTTGQYGYNTTYGGVEVYNGSAWDTITGGPAFSVYLSSSQSFSSGTFTKIQFSAKEFDTNNNFDITTNYRFTPTVAGYYQINLSFGISNTQTGERTIGVYKNGSLYKQFTDITATYIWVISGSCLVYLNGSTDYIEGWGYQNSGSTGTAYTGTQATTMQGALVRSA